MKRPGVRLAPEAGDLFFLRISSDARKETAIKSCKRGFLERFLRNCARDLCFFARLGAHAGIYETFSSVYVMLKRPCLLPLQADR